MTKQEWLQICRLNHEWYLRSIDKDASDEWIQSHMPSDKTFDDGRLEFFEKNFKKEQINEEELDKLAIKYASVPNWDMEATHFKADYRKGKED